jgi:hypothetical protein
LGTYAGIFSANVEFVWLPVFTISGFNYMQSGVFYMQNVRVGQQLPAHFTFSCIVDIYNSLSITVLFDHAAIYEIRKQNFCSYISGCVIKDD